MHHAKKTNTLNLKDYKRICRAFQSRAGEFPVDLIYDFAETEETIQNFLNDIQHIGFGVLYTPEEETGKHVYCLYVITKKDNEPAGSLLLLEPLLKDRNELTILFALDVCERYGLDDSTEVFNTYHYLQCQLFEQIDYWPFTTVKEFSSEPAIPSIKFLN